MAWDSAIDNWTCTGTKVDYRKLYNEDKLESKMQKTWFWKHSLKKMVEAVTLGIATATQAKSR